LRSTVFGRFHYVLESALGAGGRRFRILYPEQQFHPDAPVFENGRSHLRGGQPLKIYLDHSARIAPEWDTWPLQSGQVLQQAPRLLPTTKWFNLSPLETGAPAVWLTHRYSDYSSAS